MSEVVKQARPRRPSGIELINSGACPLGRSYPIACWTCPVGHATECHHPMDCETADCDHYQRVQAFEDACYGD